MKTKNNKVILKNRYYRSLVGLLLATTSLSQLTLPVLALGTTAGQNIDNTATATYKDDGGTTYDTKSNKVTIQVAKVAGITNVPNGITDANGGNILTGETLTYEFLITNTGNDAAKIFVPGKNNIVTSGLNTAGLTVQVESAPNSNDFTSVVVDDANGATIDNVAANSAIRVRVTGVVTATAAGAPIKVTLGDTGSNLDPNSPRPDTQDQPDNGTAPDALAALNEVRTQTATTSAVSGDPANDQREASALQQVFLGSNSMAMVRIRKSNAGVTPITSALSKSNPGVIPITSALTDNVITYNLAFDVLNTTPNSLYSPGALEGRSYQASKFAGITDTSNLILISDVIPNQTTFTDGSAVSPGSGEWTPVYSNDDPVTISADAATWNTDAATVAGLPGGIKRVGWVYDARPTASGGDGKLATNTLGVSGFQFKVTTTGLSASGGTIANIAQIFGNTDDGVDGTTGGTAVYDESGDTNPTNFNDDGSLGPTEANDTNGVADPAKDGIDSGNNNSATGSEGGEDNVITISPPGTILNGTATNAAASGTIFGVGPDNNHDFQNLAVSITEDENNDPVDPASPTDTVPYDPKPVQFDNTLANPGTDDLSNVLLQPVSPDFGTLGGNDSDIPNNTTVKIDLSNQTATYTYDSTTGVFTLTSGQPIVIPTVNAGGSIPYKVTVNLPDGTLPSIAETVNKGFPIPVVAFIDGNSNGSPEVTDTLNVTVDQVYTGFVKLVKQVRVLEGDTTTVRPNMDYGDADNGKQAAPGDTMEYRIIYRNISEPQAGNGSNSILNAVDLRIDENGTSTLTGGNWALDSNADGSIDTLNIQNSATDSSPSSTIEFFTGTTGATSLGNVDPGEAVTRYIDKITTLPPTGPEPLANFDDLNTGDQAFTFKRKVYKPTTP